MIRSMTGYGDAERLVEAGLLRAEIKTVNHRYLNVNVRTPPGFDRHEGDIQGWLRAHLLRGHVQLNLSLDTSVAAARDEPAGPELDWDKAHHYLRLLREMTSELGLEGGIVLHDLLRFPDLLRAPEPDKGWRELDVEVVREVVTEAARAVVRMREEEGDRLRADLEGRLDAMAAQLDEVEAVAPERLLRERDRLRSAVRDLTEREEVDEDRLAREVAYLAEKWDISEELVRFRSHLALFRETLADDTPEAVGKRLGFVVQEMNREANTLGAKANDGAVARAAVALKEEIERLREQVENVE